MSMQTILNKEQRELLNSCGFISKAARVDALRVVLYESKPRSGFVEWNRRVKRALATGKTVEQLYQEDEDRYDR